MASLFLRIEFCHTFFNLDDNDHISFDIKTNQSFPQIVLRPTGSKSRSKFEWNAVLKDMTRQAQKAKDFVDKEIRRLEDLPWTAFLEPNVLEQFVQVNVCNFNPIIIDEGYLN